MKVYDTIYIGGGLSAHVDALKKNKKEKILFIDPIDRHRFRHSWCFWHTNPYLPQHLIEKSWDSWSITYSEKTTIKSNPEAPYCLVWSDRYLRHLADEIQLKHDPLWHFNEKVVGIKDGIVKTDKGFYPAADIKDSRLDLAEFDENTLIQEFTEYHIRVPIAIWDSTKIDLMDFLSDPVSVTFFYVLPLSKSEALITPTVFRTRNGLSPNFDELLKAYFLRKFNLTLKPDSVIRKVSASIPMGFLKNKNQKLGIAGGTLKASTGYAFLENIKKINSIELPKNDFINHFMDSLFLLLIKNEPHLIPSIVFKMFKNSPTGALQAFLQGEGGLKERLHIISGLPKKPFLRQIIPYVV